jgi:hypothetical protein
MTEPTVSITVARLTELEALAALGQKLKEKNESDFKRLTELEALAAIGQKTKEKNEADFKRLEDRRKENPELRNELARNWRSKNREAYNARRRELRRQKKETAAAVALTQSMDLPEGGVSADYATTKTPGTK